MTKGRIAIFRAICRGHSKEVILEALEECLDEIERLQNEVESYHRDQSRRLAIERAVNGDE